MERISFGPASVWTSLRQTATPMPPWNGPIFISGGFAGRRVFVAMIVSFRISPGLVERMRKNGSQTALASGRADKEGMMAQGPRRRNAIPEHEAVSSRITRTKFAQD